MPQDKLPEPGEFTRIFKRQYLGAQNAADAEKKAGEISGIFPATGAPPSSPEPQLHSPNPPSPPSAPPPAAASPAPGPGSSEPGEFTQYFMGGLPAKPAVGGPNSTQRVPPGVQRPNSPITTTRNLNSDNSVGSFTDRFTSRSDAPAPRVEKSDDSALRNPWATQGPDLNKRLSSGHDEAEHLDFRPLSPAPAQRDEPGAYEQRFGVGNQPPAPWPSAVTPPPPAPIMTDSPNRPPGDSWSSRTLQDVRATPSPAPKGPSEFTVVSSGRPGAPRPEGAPPEVPASGTRKMPIGVNVTPPNLQSMIPGAGGGNLHVPGMSGASASASLSGANVSTPFGGASMHAPTLPPMGLPQIKAPGAGTPRFSEQTKLILFFGVLAIAAVILVVVLLAIQKN